jgi:hypothetical protein
LQILRWQGLVAYGAAGLAKLEPAWLDGTALSQIAESYPFAGPFWDGGQATLGMAGMSIAIAIWELALVPMLAWPRTRIAGVVLAVALHVVLDTTTLVSTFGATMVVYLVCFLPWEREGGLFSPSRASAALPST